VVHRLVVALTTLLVLVGGTVVAAYLLIFAVSPDRAARAVPADAVAYATVYLQPSAGQQMNIAALLGTVPGFADPAALDQKIHEISQRLLAQAGIDYEADVRPWLGDQVSAAVLPDADAPSGGAPLVLVGVRDRQAASAALDRLAQRSGVTVSTRDHAGLEISVAEGGAFALLDDLLLVARDADGVAAAIDADAGRAGSLAGSSAYLSAMGRVPPDHLAAAYLDLEGLAALAGVADELGGYSTASAALVVEHDGLHVMGQAPFDADAATDDARAAFALGSERSSLAEWMPADTQVEAVIFGPAQSINALEGGGSTLPEIGSLIAQIRAGAAFALGLDIDRDVVPLLDREAAVAFTDVAGDPAGALLLRPSDPAAAGTALGRVEEALRNRARATITSHEIDGFTVTTAAVFGVGSAAYAEEDGVFVAGLDAARVAGVLAAHRDGATLADDARYASAWQLAGARGGNELFIDVGAIVDAAGEEIGLSGDERDMLLQIGAVGATFPASSGASELHIVLTTR
jgi:Protein of unknown function (DUF3352)